MALRRRHAHGRADGAFLGWPIDGLYVAIAYAYLALRLLADGDAVVRQLWMSPYRAAVTLTHDVEGVVGQDRSRALSELEASLGFRSCFNFVAERYPVDAALMSHLRDRGFEIGVHGIKHDGKKFRSRRVFEERLKALQEYGTLWKAVGFRSPATHRRWDWMPELPFEYDSSYPDTDPYEPMAGGCASPWPFLIGDLVELPITLPQDHTAWELLRRDAYSLWREKADWLCQCGGLINIVVHPDYLTTESRWSEYERFLRYLKDRADVWVALPKEVADWWRGPAGQVTAALDERAGRLRVKFTEGVPR